MRYFDVDGVRKGLICGCDGESTAHEREMRECDEKNDARSTKHPINTTGHHEEHT